MFFSKAFQAMGVVLAFALIASCQNEPEKGQNIQEQLVPNPAIGHSTSTPDVSAEPSLLPEVVFPVPSPTETEVVPTEPSPSVSPEASPSVVAPAPIEQTVKVILSQSEIVRTLKGDTLEIVRALPPGTELTLPRDAPPGNFKYRLSSGATETSSNYFFSGIRIQMLPRRDAEIDALHALPGGLYLSSTIADDVQESVIVPVKPGEVGADFLKFFSRQGKPSFQYSSYFRTRFGSSLNKKASPTASELAKSKSIFAELRSFASRAEFVDSARYFIPLESAKSASLLFEKTDVVHNEGAWSIAVKATAPRHGFPNVPCAEFVSEVIRQSYMRTGYSHFEDFNIKKGNPLIWSKTAAVVTLADYLAKAGWIPWEAYRFQPPAGALMMHYKATTPGHAYLIGEDGGQIVVDNGAPRGRDLRVTAEKYIRMMYLHGVFFLPPGVIPAEWGRATY